jgi:hypothetical protein
MLYWFTEKTYCNNAWQLVPKTYYLANNRELEYNFLFNSQKVESSLKEWLRLP